MGKMRVRYGILFIYFLILFACINNLAGQVDNIKFKHLTVENGLSQNWVECIKQDSYGFMWFGTGGNGVNKYDGHEFKVYKNNPKDNTSLTDNWISLLYEDKNKRLWVGTQHGLNYYDREKDKFFRFQVFPNQIVCGFFESKEGNLYVVTGNNIFELDFAHKTAIPFCKNDSNCYGNIFISCKQDNDKLWVCSFQGLFLFDVKNKTYKVFKHNATDDHSISDNALRSVYKDGKGRIWFGSFYKGLILLNDDSRNSSKPRFTNFIHDPNNKNSINAGTVYSIFDDNGGHLWIGLENGGVDILDLQSLENGNPIFRHFKYDLNDETSISNNSVYAIANDNQGTIWIGTYSGGLNYYNKMFNKFKHYKLIPNTKSSINNNMVNCFLEEGDNLWIGTEGGINILNKKTGLFRFFKNDYLNPSSIGSNSIITFLKDHKDNIWVGAWDGGLNLYNRKSQTFTRFVHDDKNPNSLSSNNIFGLAEDDKGYIWVATMSGGLNRFDPVLKKFKVYHTSSEGKNSISGEWVQAILESSAHELWVATSDGVDLFDKNKEIFTNFWHDSANAKSISYNGANVIFEDSKKNIWIGTNGGLNLFIRKDSSFRCFNESDGLPDNAVKSISEDKQGNLWISTNKGISKFINATLIPLKPHFKNFNKDDGLQSNEFSRKSSLLGADGLMYFGGINGFNTFNPEILEMNGFIPNTVFTELLVNNKPVEIGAKDSPIKENISIAKEIVLSNSQPVFSLRYAALSYISSQNNQYAYILEGFEKQWNYVGNKREATYTNLDPGNYVFRVKACNNDGIWNTNGTSIKIKILPPWYNTWWFRVLMYSFIAVFIFLLIWLRLKFYRKQNVKLSTMVKERTKELEEVNVYLEEKQEEINNQNEELMSQRDALEEANNKLEKQKIQILEQNKELDLHRNELENLVEERTHQLIVAKDKAEESDRLKTSFLANLSHEIRTPLNAIVGFSTMALEETFTEDEKADHKQIIQRSSDSLLSLISDIIDFSKIESGNIDIVFRDVTFAHIIARIGDIFKTQLHKQQIGVVHELELMVDFPDELHNISLETDEMRLLQVLSNLIHNAIKFTSKGVVQIGCRLADEQRMAEFYVRDTGIGIRKEHHDIIFERFRKIENDKSTLHRGSGIGLSISQHLVRMLGGHIRVDSEPNLGTTFYFTIPVKKDVAAVTEHKSKLNEDKEMVDFKKALVLVAEDDLANYIIIEKFLQKYNIQVLRAVNGVHAVNMALSDSDIQLILMDIKMPEMDGVEALHQIRDKGIAVPVVAQTAYALAHEVVKLKQEGFDDYITKPLDFDVILKILQKYLSS